MLDGLGAATDPTLSRMASADVAMTRAKQALNHRSPEEFEGAAKDFERMFLAEMVSHMFETVGVDPLFGGGEAEGTWRSMMVDEYSKQIVNSGGIGMSDSVKAHMITLQEAVDQNEQSID